MVRETGLRRKPAGRAIGDGAAVGLPVELAALRGRVADATLLWAYRRAQDIGVGGDEVLIHAGFVTQDAATAAVADHLGLAIADLSKPVLVADQLVPGVLRTQSLVIATAGRPRFVLAPRGRGVRRLARLLAREPALAHRVELTTPERLRGRLVRQASGYLARMAAFGLRDRTPRHSAATIARGRALVGPLTVFAASLGAVIALVPAPALLAIGALVSLVFLSAMALRLSACFIPEGPVGEAVIPDRHLPVYTLIVPLYREAAVLPHLEAALCGLDYPMEKLDIKLVVEPDDAATRAAIRRRALPLCFETVVAPALGPRTKPKALNAALPFARGSFVAVFDAEDVPAPNQLRAALEAFRRGGPKVGCVQARLVAENASDSWISRHFAAEYSAQFHVVLPALAALRLPILLGGTSNHFRRSALEGAGAWDPFNVTEDADLGLRLARLGWDTEVIACDTLEEAPVSLRAWLRQRTRWMKGWAQTLLVHGRNPRRILRELGIRRTLGAALLTVGPFAAMLVHPLTVVVLARDLWVRTWGAPAESTVLALAAALSYTTFVAGYGATAAVTLVALYRRRRLAEGWILLTLPAYWLLQSLAAWRALIDLVVDPFRWDKTEHGISPRRVQQGAAVTDSAAARPPLGPAVAWR
ncbi:glycosyltransferase [Aquabacter spiritensis]|uniref:Cellulose synthase/poly-beta-1,6-N-acetylglucosamine synthase-like glycosyltransferase n=1 Tax=Aquabacter spiritensis TaxID=933073 RepID=A0A4R3LWS9_9HYPH|nr:glycosyltransferase [Aquabacter spiritensis]TCT05080.1 cellulose synthase/poly-beta-1,6-N-acetylglucosamine synthase-like glycosyltransferase [Aquabacter spiritensis]